MTKLIQIRPERYEINTFLINGNKIKIHIFYFIYLIIKHLKIDVYLHYIRDNAVIIFIKEDDMDYIIKNYYIYHLEENCYRVNLKKLYEENIIKTIPYVLLSHIKFKYLSNYKNIYKKISNRNKDVVENYFDLKLYYDGKNKVKESLSNIYIHLDQLEYFLEKMKIGYRLKKNRGSKYITISHLSDFIDIWKLNIYENKEDITSRFFLTVIRYCFLNNIDLYSFPFLGDIYEDIGNVFKKNIKKFVKNGDLNAKDYECLKNKHLCRNGIISHFNNNSNCFVSISFILQYLLKISKHDKNRYANVANRTNDFYNENKSYFSKSNMFEVDKNIRHLIHKEDIHIIMNFVRKHFQ